MERTNPNSHLNLQIQMLPFATSQVAIGYDLIIEILVVFLLETLSTHNINIISK